MNIFKKRKLERERKERNKGVVEFRQRIWFESLQESHKMHKEAFKLMPVAHEREEKILQCLLRIEQILKNELTKEKGE